MSERCVNNKKNSRYYSTDELTFYPHCSSTIDLITWLVVGLQKTNINIGLIIGPLVTRPGPEVMLTFERRPRIEYSYCALYMRTGLITVCQFCDTNEETSSSRNSDNKSNTSRHCNLASSIENRVDNDRTKVNSALAKRYYTCYL